MSNKATVIAKYEQIHALYEGVPEARQTLIVADGAILQRDYALAEATLSNLPDEQKLFTMLAARLTKSNAVTRTLKEIRENKGTVGKATMLKGLFSMGTHAMIEVEKGDGRYMALAKRICERIQKAMSQRG